MNQLKNINTEKLPPSLPDPHQTLEDAQRKIILYGTERKITDWPKHTRIMQRLYARKRRALAQILM